jgi:hypothetical protein
MKVYYHKHWSESNKGGASMLHAEEYVYSSDDLSDSRELQDDSQADTSGWDCHRYVLEWEGDPSDFCPESIADFDEGLPFAPASGRDKFAWEIEQISEGEVSTAQVLAMTTPEDWGDDYERSCERWVEYAPNPPGGSDDPCLVFCSLSWEPGAATNRDYRPTPLIYA